MIEMWLLWILLIWWITMISPWFHELLELAQGGYSFTVHRSETMQKLAKMFHKPFQPQLPGKRHQALPWNKPWALDQDGHLLLSEMLALWGLGEFSAPGFPEDHFSLDLLLDTWASWGQAGLWAVLKHFCSANVNVCLPHGTQRCVTPSVVGHAEEFGFYVSFRGGYALSRRAVRREFGTTCGCVRLAFLCFTILSVPGLPAHSVRQSKGPRSWRLESHPRLWLAVSAQARHFLTWLLFL